MATIASLVVDLEARTARLEQGLAKAQRANRNYTNRTRQQYTQLTSTLNTFRRAAIAAIGVLGARQISGTLDSVTNINNQLRSAGIEADQLGQAFERVRDLANSARAPIEDTARLFSQILISTQRFGATLDQVETVTRAIQQAFQVAGTSAASAAGATQQLLQALQSGVLRGEEFNSVNENSNILIRQIAASIGVSVDNMRALAEEGLLTSDVVFAALLNSAEDIQTQFDNTVPTFESIGNIISNNILPAFASVAALIQPIVQGFAAWVGETENVNRFISGVVGAIAAITAAQTIRGLLSVVSAIRAMAVAARSLSIFTIAASGGLAALGAAAGVTAAVTAYDQLADSAEDAADATIELSANTSIVGQSLDEAIAAVNEFRGGLMTTSAVAMELSETLMDEVDPVARSVLDGVTDQITDLVTTGRASFRDFANDVIRQFIRIRIRSAILGIFGGGASGTFFQGLTPRQNGGPVSANRPYLVGERGPEIFVPNAGGHIVPNGGGSGQVINYNINAVDAQSFQQLVARNPEFIYQTTQRGARELGLA